MKLKRQQSSLISAISWTQTILLLYLSDKVFHFVSQLSSSQVEDYTTIKHKAIYFWF